MESANAVQDWEQNVQDGMEDGQFWDTEKPYHSVRLVKGTSKGDVLLVRGGGHPAGIKPEEINRDTYGVLERWARRRWPQAGEVAWQWAGQVTSFILHELLL